jgi:hypothetical protein
MESGKSDFENIHCMTFYMGQLDVPSCNMKQKAYMKSLLETSVYMISHYDSNGCVKRHSENVASEVSPCTRGYVQEDRSEKKGRPILLRDEEMHEVSL